MSDNVEKFPMSSSYFEAISLPFEQTQNLSTTSRFSKFYCREKPAVPIVGDFQTRYCTLQDTFKNVVDRVYNFKVCYDDIFLVTNPKCGTTWMQELTWLILNDCNFAQAKDIDITIRSPFLEFSGLGATIDNVEAANNLKSPRLLKSHLPVIFLPKDIWRKQTKIIFVFRNPKDAAVSYFHHWRGFVNYKGAIEDFMKFFLNDQMSYAPFWPTVLDFWNLRHQPQILFTSYERMKFDLPSVIENVCRFLDKPIPAKDNYRKLIDHLSFDQMKNNPSCNHFRELKDKTPAVDDFRFVRRGIVGSYKDELSMDIIQQFDDWIADNLKVHNLNITDFINYCKF